MDLIEKAVKIKYAILYIECDKKALDFYINLLGFQVADQINNIDEDWWILNKPNDQNFSLMLIKDKHAGIKESAVQKNTLILNTQDCLFEYSRLMSLEIEFINTPSYTPLGLSVSFFDPFLNRIIFLEERTYSEFN